MADQPSNLYLGLAGETGPGRVVHSGFFRLPDGGNEWEALQRGLPQGPAVRALAVHPAKSEIIYAGTQSGVYRSADRGEHWEKVELPDHGLPVWSILFHPHNPDVILVGCENCEIYRSDDAGELDASAGRVRFPGSRAHANAAKRVLMLDGGASEPDAPEAIEVRHDPLDRRRRALGKSEPRPIHQRRHGRHARRPRQSLAARYGVRYWSRRHVPQRGWWRPLESRAAGAA